MMFGGDGEGFLSGGGFEDGVALAGEVMVDDGADPLVVVADQDGACGARGWWQLFEQDVGGTDSARQHDVQRGSGAEVALRPDGAAVLLDDAAADGETETGSALLAGVGGFDLLEAVEDAVELVGRNAAAFVGDLEQDGVRGGFREDADGGGCGRELDGVGEEIGEDLEDAVGVTIEEERFGCGGLRGGERRQLEVDGVGVGHAGHRLDGLLGEFAEGATANLERGAAGLHALKIEDVVDEADQAVGVGHGDAEQILGLGIDVADDARREQAESAADAGERSAQLVGDGGDELILEVI